MWVIIISILIIISDQALKTWSVNNLPLNQSQTWLDRVISWHYIQNEGASWGMLAGRSTLLIMISLVAVVYLSYLAYHNRQQSQWIQLGLGLVIGGALGNLIDRILYGYVIDMFKLEFIDFPVFNIADSAITVGILILIAATWLLPEERGLKI